MTPIGLEAFKKNEATYLGDMPSDHDPPLVEVVQEGVSFPQPSEKETQTAVEELMNELNGMVDQATQTCPPQFTLTRVYDSPEEFAEAKRKTPPPPAKDDNEGLKRMVRMATIFQSPPLSKPTTPSPTQFGGLHGLPLPRGSFGGAPVSKGMELCQMSHSTLFAVLWQKESPRLYEGGVSSTSFRGVRHVELFVVLLP